MKSVLALFPNVASVNMAIDSLRDLGYTDDVISVITKKDNLKDNEINVDNDSVAGIKEGAKMGGAIGGVIGLLAGIGAISIPGLGVLLISGPLATALGLTGVAGATATGALTGALAGGLVATLKEIGIDEPQARLYEERVKSGYILLGVASEEDQADEAQLALERAGAYDVKVFELRPMSYDEDENQNMFTGKTSHKYDQTT